jgi:hypothetical protein
VVTTSITTLVSFSWTVKRQINERHAIFRQFSKRWIAWDEGWLWQTAPEFCHPLGSGRNAARQKLRIVSGQWMSGLETRAARNVVIVSTATKLARIYWAVAT